MAKAYVEQDFNDIFDGISTKLDFKKLNKFKGKRKFAAFKKLIDSTNLKNMSETNKKKLYSYLLANVANDAKGKLVNLKKKISITAKDEKEIKKLERTLEDQKTLPEFEKKQLTIAKRIVTIKKKEERIAAEVKEKGYILRYIPERKGTRGRKPVDEKTFITKIKGGFEGKTNTGKIIIFKNVKIMGKKRILVFEKGKPGIRGNLKG